jgi:hypothetical protein
MLVFTVAPATSPIPPQQEINTTTYLTTVPNPGGGRTGDTE